MARKFTLRDHPDFPFRPEISEKLRAYQVGFIDRPEAGRPERELLAEFVHLVHRFAFLERLIQGDVRYEIPLHTEALRPAGESIEDQAERRAMAELGLLGGHECPAAELIPGLEEMGVKILALGRSSENASSLSGAFFFEGVLGPAFLLGTTLHSAEAAFVAAHQLGHWISDFDPYRARWCEWELDSLQNLRDTPEERRADRFARALLLPGVVLRRTLTEAEPMRHDSEDGRLRLIATLFEVPEAVIHRRLADLALEPLPPSSHSIDVPALTETTLDAGVEALPGPSGNLLGLPERYVNLCLAAWVERLCEQDLLAQFLRTNEAETQEWIDRSGLSRRSPERASFADE